jgi:hypothetical protein
MRKKDVVVVGQEPDWNSRVRVWTRSPWHVEQLGAALVPEDFESRSKAFERLSLGEA